MNTPAETTLEIKASEDVGSVATLTDLPDASPERRTARLTLYAGLALMGLGWLLIYLGYNGTATNPVLVAQIPYVVSGGLAGLSLIVTGSALIIVSVLLRAQAAARADVLELAEEVRALGDVVSQLGFNPGTSAKGSSNGHVVAVRGGSSFHKPGCRLVTDSSALRHYQPGDASKQGLQPCRVCKP